MSKDVVHGAQGGRELRWDIYKPSTPAEGAPAVLVLHGGGWRVGDRSMMAAACAEFAQRGYVAIAPEYRLLGEAKWPAPLDDVKLAIQSLRAQSAALGVSAKHIFLTGFSAGAHLALLAASALRKDIAGVAAFFPPARVNEDIGKMLELSGAANLTAVSPVEHAGNLPPTIVFCGDADDMTPADLSLDLYKAIRKAGGTADLRLYSHMIHEFVHVPGMLDLTVGDAVRFFDRTAIHKEQFDAGAEGHAKFWASMMAAARAQAQQS
jgi:acetyl esterase/lipase